jgi:pimeloyl-ACP methyl ester carboxylesterase
MVRLGTGLRYHVLEWGADDISLQHTVLMLHGFLDLAWAWVHTVEAALAGRFHVIAPDLRGHGDSDRVGPGGYYHFVDYIADVHDLAAELGRDRISIVGHSMGGSIATMYTGAFPDRVASVALLEGLGPPEQTTPMPDRVVAWLAGWKRARDAMAKGYDSIEQAAARLRSHDPLLEEALSLELAAHATRIDKPPDGDGKLRFKHDPLHGTLSPYPFRFDAAASFWQRIDCPVLVVEASESAFHHSAEEMNRRLSCLAHVERVELAGAGHMMHRHQPAALGALLADFLSRAGS